MPETGCGVNRGLKDFQISFVNQYPILRVMLHHFTVSMMCCQVAIYGGTGCNR